MPRRKPRRIQRRRTAGWRMPPGAIYVGRPTVWGNPFVGDRAVQCFREYARVCLLGESGRFVPTSTGVYIGDNHFKVKPTFLPTWQQIERANLEDLRGKDLCCWCPLDRPCHADVLLELANS